MTTRRNSQDPVSGDWSYSKQGILERRFDVQPAAFIENPHEKARQTFYALTPAQKDVLSFWVAHALYPDRIASGLTYNDLTTGGSWTEGLLQLAREDTGLLDLSHDALKGSLLVSGKAYYPNLRTAHKPIWHIPAMYAGIPSARQGQFDVLKAAL